MRNITRKGITGILASVMGATALVSLPGSALAADSSGPTSSPAAYLAWLDAQSNSYDDRTARGFKALSVEDQEKFLGYLKDPKHMKAFAAAVNGKGAARTELANGDVVIERESGTSPALQSGDMSAWHSVTDTFLGVDVTKVHIRVNYHVSGTNTTKVYAGSASSEDSVPGYSATHSVVSEWISAEPADNAHSETTWTADWAGYSWSSRHRVWADYSGFKGGYLKRD